MLFFTFRSPSSLELSISDGPRLGVRLGRRRTAAGREWRRRRIAALPTGRRLGERPQQHGQRDRSAADAPASRHQIPPNVEGTPSGAPGGGYCYGGPHPANRAGSGRDTAAPHMHAYAPFDLRLFSFHEGCYYFIGDPHDFGYRGQSTTTTARTHRRQLRWRVVLHDRRAHPLVAPVVIELHGRGPLVLLERAVRPVLLVGTGPITRSTTGATTHRSTRAGGSSGRGAWRRPSRACRRRAGEAAPRVAGAARRPGTSLGRTASTDRPPAGGWRGATARRQRLPRGAAGCRWRLAWRALAGRRLAREPRPEHVVTAARAVQQRWMARARSLGRRVAAPLRGRWMALGALGRRARRPPGAVVSRRRGRGLPSGGGFHGGGSPRRSAHGGHPLRGARLS